MPPYTIAGKVAAMNITMDFYETSKSLLNLFYNMYIDEYYEDANVEIILPQKRNDIEK